MADRRRRSRHEIDATAVLDHWAVVVLGWARRMPRHFGDNRGWWAIKAVVTKDPKGYFSGQDLGAIEVVPWAALWTPARVWAERLRAALVAEIAREGEHMRRAWYDFDPAVAELTLRSVAERERIEVMSHEEHLARIAAAVEREVTGWREGRR